MRVALLSTYDVTTGAARSAYRLLQGLASTSVDARMYVQHRAGQATNVVGPRTSLAIALSLALRQLEKLPLRFRRRPTRTYFSIGYVPRPLPKALREFRPHVTNLHWTNHGFLDVTALRRLPSPLVWTLHDMWAFTGGCHYDLECGRYRNCCGRCPVLGSLRDWDLSRWNLRRKRVLWAGLDLTVVTPSRWLASCAQGSSVFRNVRVERIPYGLDLQQYRPLGREAARKRLGLPQGSKLILFGALGATTDQRKGIQHLCAALDMLRDRWAGRAELLIFGAPATDTPVADGFRERILGHLHDEESLTLAYSAADVFVAPSEQDNLPNTVLEAIACGTPCVAFRIGGMPDLIETGGNGYLADPFDISDLARGIDWVLADGERYTHLAARSREKAEQEFPLNLQARRYEALYREMAASAPGGRA